MSEEETRVLDRVRAVRGGHSGVVTKLIREADEILSTTDRLDDTRRGRVSVIKQQLAGKIEALNEMDKDILSRCELTVIDAEIEESETVIAKIISCKRRIEERMSSMVSSAPAVSPVASTHPVTPNPSKPRLPKLILPKFKGDVKNWPTFLDSFQSAVHNNTDIPSVDKFNYLNSLLEDTAFKTIQGLPLTETNYGKAVKLLRDRFGNQQ